MRAAVQTAAPLPNAASRRLARLLPRFWGGEFFKAVKERLGFHGFGVRRRDERHKI
jgi:hypothetical protein